MLETVSEVVADEVGDEALSSILLHSKRYFKRSFMMCIVFRRSETHCGYFEIERVDALDKVAEVVADKAGDEALSAILLHPRQCFKHSFILNIDLFQPKTSTFSTRTLILVHFKTVH